MLLASADKTDYYFIKSGIQDATLIWNNLYPFLIRDIEQIDPGQSIVVFTGTYSGKMTRR
ncbi:hypothetical protein AT746_02430 [Lacimicrobium alkaliphilum]|uniref:Uncharacterized protein n=1 Tax=Lacimicrobium alkaliphilum TaxID=1526571 RepID=A0A0U3A898_9ALTE|nr:hypothetical protein AT746_02430 [Lacimicrobium alkaliphilum]